MDTTEFYKEWSEAHPDSLIRSIMKISFGAEGAFVVLFSDKPV